MPPPQSAVQPQLPVFTSQSHAEGKQPKLVSHTSPWAQPWLEQPAGLGPEHVPPAGTQIPPLQSLLHTHEPASQKQSEGAQPCVVSQNESVGQPLTTQPAGLGPSQSGSTHAQISQPSAPF